jgi:excisionase family DNA binding protein
MTTQPKRSLTQQLDALDTTTILQLLADLHKRRAQMAQLERLLQARLAQLMAPPAAPQTDELLTAKEAAARLKLSTPRIYELVKLGRLPKVQFGKQIRIPAHALDEPERDK